MSTIKVLPEHLINQIAAGEVVERPASVVKELVENALDAHAKNIIVEIDDADEITIRVADDGIGMDKNDAILAFERPATSKIADTEDLFRINTLGFRGEALASIASVSHIHLQTRQKHQIEGTSVSIEGGKTIKIKPVGTAVGTQIEVKKLFFNTPARRKYLKSIGTEFGHILDIIQSTALAFHKTGFRLIHNGKIVFDAPPATEDFSRIRAVLGSQIAEELFPVYYGHSEIKLHGYIAKPLIAASHHRNQYIFVNSRPIKSHLLAYAVKQSYHSLLPKEKHPLFLLYFELTPGLVDVNVHPRKQEVRFQNEKEMFSITEKACKHALENFVLAPKIDANNFSYTEESGLVHDYTHHPAASYKLKEKPVGVAYGRQKIASHNGNNSPAYRDNPRIVQKGIVQEALNFTKEFIEKENVPYTARDEIKKIIPIAQLAGSYILCHQTGHITDKNALVIVDQHAAHERIRYTELLQQFNQKQKISQPLLQACQLELSHQEILLLQSYTELLQALGFEIEFFSGNTINVYAVPADFTKIDIKLLILGMIDELSKKGQSATLENMREIAIMYLACRSSVKFGDILSCPEQQALLEKLQTLQTPYTCPHGRPTMITLSFEELKKRFGRNYR